MSTISIFILQRIQGPRVCNRTGKEKEMFKCGKGRNESVIVLHDRILYLENSNYSEG